MFLIHKHHVQAFVECPWKFWQIVSGKTFEQNVSMQIGDLFHRFAKEFFEFAEAEAVDPERQFLALIPQEYPPVVRRLCETFVRWEAQRLLRMRREGTAKFWKPVAREIYLENTAEGIAGTIDRVDELPDGSVIIIEYKTGSPRIATVRRELGFYALLAQPYFPVSMVGMFNPDKPLVFTQRVDNSMLQRTRRYVLQIRQAIELRNFPRHSGDWCTFCPFLSDCVEVIE